MGRFQRKLEGWRVPAWNAAYVDYKQLKRHLKQLQESKHVVAREYHHEISMHPCTHEQSEFKATTQEHFLSSLMNASLVEADADGTKQLKHYQSWSLWSPSEVYMVIHHRRSEACATGDDFYETQLLGTASKNEAQKLFFKRLDDQLNMVNRFYKSREHEYITWTRKLQKQVNIWLEPRLQTEPEYLCLENGESEKSMVFGVQKTNTTNRTDYEGTGLYAVLTDLYQSLRLLKEYSSLNVAAFTKILKKHDKITGQNVSDVYLRAVQCAYFASSNKVLRTMDQIQLLLVTDNPKGHCDKALARHNKMQHKQDSSTMFLLGIFSGSSIVLLVMFTLLTILQHSGTFQTRLSYSEFDFCTFSTLALILLHMYVYTFNVYIWESYQISYTSIFEIEIGTRLAICEMLLLCTAITTLLLGGMIMQLVFYISDAYVPVHQTGNMVPITITLLLCCILLFIPFNIFCKPIRFKLLQHIGHVISSPLHKVTFADFFLADQLTSQISAFQNVGWIFSYYICKHFELQEDDACTENNIFRNFAYFMSALPYWWRLMQCLKTWLDEGDRSQIANGGKYLSALLAIMLRVTFEQDGSHKWLIVFVTSSALATCYQLYWDIVVDWGLLKPNAVSPWLRDKLILRQQCIYFISMGINTILRLAWLFSVLHLQGTWINHKVFDFLFASTEVLRRGLWNFFRLENEHLKNAAKYQAFKALPMPAAAP